jgi:hypothetical protein
MKSNNDKFWNDALATTAGDRLYHAVPLTVTRPASPGNACDWRTA